MTLIDQFVASWVLLILVLLEIAGVCYIYGKYDNERYVHTQMTESINLQLPTCLYSTLVARWEPFY